MEERRPPPRQRKVVKVRTLEYDFFFLPHDYTLDQGSHTPGL